MLRTVAEGLQVLDHPLRMPLGVQIGTRTTVVRLPDGTLLLHAPGPLTAEEIEAVKAEGQVTTLVAPNSFHHMFLADALRAFPDATLHAVPSVQKRHPDLPSVTLGAEPAPAWKGVLEQVVVEGAPRLDEVVFFHPASRTLLLVDLCFNMQHSDSGFTRVFFRIAGAWQRFGPSRLAKSFFKDKAALRASLDRILAWDFDRVIVTHGDVVETGGREGLREAFAFL